MDKANEYRSKVNRILRERGFKRKDIADFWEDVIKLAHKKRLDKPQKYDKSQQINTEPKYLANYLFKRLNKSGYKISKSKRIGSKSYYLKNESTNYKNIRVSDHELHPSQYRDNTVTIVVLDTGRVNIEGQECIPYDGCLNYRSYLTDELLDIIEF